MMRPEFQGAGAGFQQFSGDADEIIGLNLEVWQDGFCGVKWPDHYLVIGDDDAGNHYFTDVTKDRPAVFLADYEETVRQKRLVTSETYETFGDFLADIPRLQSEVKTSEVQPEQAPVRKPWWRFG